MKYIIFENENKTIGIITPAEECLRQLTQLFKQQDSPQSELENMSLMAIAKKDTPFNFPFWIIEDSQLPTDYSTRSTWIVDPKWGEPDGVGHKSNKFI